MPSNVGYVRNEAGSLLPIWFMIRDCIEGDPAIKGEFGVRTEFYPSALGQRSQARKYLPQPNAQDTSLPNQERYRQYVQRAYWYNFTSRTLDGLVGQVYLRPPVVKLPPTLDSFINNADGNGLNLTQLSKRATQNTMAYGRCGLLTDYPPVNKVQTADEVKAGVNQPTVKCYFPWQIRNWATIQRGSHMVLSLVVLEEYLIEEDEFALVENLTYRVLRLDPVSGNYTVQIFSQDDPKKGNKASNMKGGETIVPLDFDGQPFDVIPFSFVGSEANDVYPDRPPLYDLAALNVSHYRNSADYEESAHIVGQPTPVIAGLTEEWATDILKGVVTFGSRAAIMLPQGGTAELLQAQPNSMPMEAMKAKEDQALALGAKLVQHQKTIRTATEVMVDTTSETSVLSNVALNVSAALTQNLKWACRFAGQDDTDVSFTLNTEFELTRMNANDRLAIVKMWQSGAIAFTEMRDVLRVDGTANLPDDQAADQIAAEMAAATLTTPPIADPLQASVPTAPENNPGSTGAPAPAPKQQFPVVPVAPKKSAKKATAKPANNA